MGDAYDTHNCDSWTSSKAEQNCSTNLAGVQDEEGVGRQRRVQLPYQPVEPPQRGVQWRLQYQFSRHSDDFQ